MFAFGVTTKPSLLPFGSLVATDKTAAEIVSVSGIADVSNKYIDLCNSSQFPSGDPVTKEKASPPAFTSLAAEPAPLCLSAQVCPTVPFLVQPSTEVLSTLGSGKNVLSVLITAT